LSSQRLWPNSWSFLLAFIVYLLKVGAALFWSVAIHAVRFMAGSAS
jgi:hypothetical protein